MSTAPLEAAYQIHSPGLPSVAAAEQTEMRVETVLSPEGVEGNIVLLRTEEDTPRFLPIWVGNTEALAIRLRMVRHKAPRPLTMDLLEKVIEHMQGEVVSSHIDDVKEGVYLGRVSLRAGDRVIDLDARPSDAIALALGARLPILVDQRVMDEASVTPDELRKRGAPSDEEDLGRSL